MLLVYSPIAITSANFLSSGALIRVASSKIDKGGRILCSSIVLPILNCKDSKKVLGRDQYNKFGKENPYKALFKVQNIELGSS
jgi:hypothetical protein